MKGKVTVVELETEGVVFRLSIVEGIERYSGRLGTKGRRAIIRTLRVMVKDKNE